MSSAPSCILRRSQTRWLLLCSVLPGLILLMQPRPSCAAQAATPVRIAGPTLTLQAALRYAQAFNHDLVVRSLERDRTITAELAARVWQNPQISYHLNNVVLGRGNEQERDLHPKPFSQLVHSAELTQVLDIAAKRRARLGHARAQSAVARALYADAVRELRFAVRTRFVEVLRAQRLVHLGEQSCAHWAQTLTLSEHRHRLGELATLELDKFGLELSRATVALYDAQAQLASCRHSLAALLGLAGSEALPDVLVDEDLATPGYPASGQQLTDEALERRPDVLAVEAQRQAARRAMLVARREVYPDVALSLQYTRSHFQVSGDNPHALGLGIELPLPLLDTQRAARTDAHLAIAQMEHARRALVVRVGEEVRQALVRREQAQKSVALLSRADTIVRAERARDAAVRARASGARSLLEVLEAERTLIALRSEWVDTHFALAQAEVELMYVTSSDKDAW